MRSADSLQCLAGLAHRLAQVHVVGGVGGGVGVGVGFGVGGGVGVDGGDVAVVTVVVGCCSLLLLLFFPFGLFNSPKWRGGVPGDKSTWGNSVDCVPYNGGP